MSDKRQGSIEWFQEQIIKIVNGTCELSEIEIFERAKAMHKEEIIDAYWYGGQDVPMHINTCKRYYNETFGETKN